MWGFGLPFYLEWYVPLLLKAGPLKMPGRHRYEVVDSRSAPFLVDTQEKTARQTPLTHSQVHKHNNPQLGRVSRWNSKTLLFGEKKREEALRGGQGHVWFRSGRATSAQQAHMTSALSTLTASWLCSICSWIFGWYLHTVEGIWVEFAEDPACTFSIGLMRRHLALQCLTSLLYKVGVITSKYFCEWMVHCTPKPLNCISMLFNGAYQKSQN